MLHELMMPCFVMNSTVFPIIGEVTFSLSVQPPMEYSLDLYLLMYLSCSMCDDLSNVQALASDIGKYFICMVIKYLFCKEMHYGIGGVNG